MVYRLLIVSRDELMRNVAQPLREDPQELTSHLSLSYELG